MLLDITKLKYYTKKHEEYVNGKLKQIKEYVSHDNSKSNKSFRNLPPWEQWKSKTPEQLEKISKQFIIDYDYLIKNAEILNSKFGIISSILRNNVSVSTYLNDEIKTFDFDSELQCVNDIISMNRDAILLILKSVITKEPKPCNDDPCQVEVQKDFSFMRRANRYKFGMVKWSEGQRIPKSDYRYIINCEVKSSIELFLNELSYYKSQGKGTPLTDTVRESMLYYKLLTKTLNQSRSINIAKMCFASILMIYSVPTNNNTLHHCFSEQNPSIYYLQKMLEDYISWPFLDTTTEMYYPNEFKMSSQLPIMVYTVLNKSLAYTFGVITIGYFNLLMSVFLEWAKTSFDDEHLLQKSNMNKVTKLLNECVVNSNIFTFSNSTVIGVRNVNNEEEFWYKTEKNDLLDIFKNIKSTKLYFDYVQGLLKRKFSRDELILHKMALENCSNNSTFKKSSPAMEYERSAKPRLNKPVTQPYPEEMIDGFTCKPRYSGILKEVWDELYSKVDEIAEKLKNHDFQAEFYERLTNNSSGLTPAHIQQSKISHPILRTFQSAPYGQRYITALVDNEVLFNKINALDSLTSWVLAGKREQIDRRVRWIMMVLNVLQAVFSVALTVGKQQHKTVNFVASGKQVGNVKDMLQVLATSGDMNTIITDNDIVGMDSSTQEQIVGLTLCFVYQVLSKVGKADYFYTSGREAIAKVFDELGNVIGTKGYKINGVQDYMIDMIGAMRSNNFIFVDTWVGSEVTIPGSVFWSGAYHTAVQHNVWLSETVSILQRNVMNRYTETQARIIGSILGDDLAVGIIQNTQSKVADKNAVEIIDKLIAMLSESGFEADPESSRCSSTFLQQTGLYGGVKPKFARLALNVSEHEIARTRDPISQIKEIGDILDEMSGRAPFPNAAINILNAYWAVNRIINFSKGVEGNKAFSQRLNQLKETMPVNFKSWIKIDKNNSIRVIIPFVGIYLTNIFGNTFPSFYSVIEGKVMSPSFMSPKGVFTERCLFEIAYNKLTLEEQNEIILKDKESREKKAYLEYKRGLISEKTYMLRRNLPGRVHVSKRIDYKKISNLGFTFAQWLSFNIVNKAEMSKKDKENPNFNVIVNIGKAKQNQARSALAHIGVNALLEGGHRISESLVYYNQPKVRIQQAFALKNERLRKFGENNESVVDKLINYVKQEDSHKFIFKDIGLLDYSIIETDIEINLSPDFDLIARSTLGPCASSKTPHYRGLQLFGFPFSIPSRDAAVESFKNVLSFGADAELVLSEAVKVYNKDNKLLSSFFYAIGIPSTDHKRMENVVKEFRFQSITSYSAIFNVRKFFYFTPHTRNSTNLSIYKPPRYRHQRWAILHDMIVRDYFLAYPNQGHRIILKLSDTMIDKLMTL